MFGTSSSFQEALLPQQAAVTSVPNDWHGLPLSAWLNLDDTWSDSQNFSSVVGPNGSGKSNVIDAMLFVFGKRAKQVLADHVSCLTLSSSANARGARLKLGSLLLSPSPEARAGTYLPGFYCGSYFSSTMYGEHSASSGLLPSAAISVRRLHVCTLQVLAVMSISVSDH
jgi:energy-coupling factor transporter ATP-binding protein EcfA2